MPIQFPDFQRISFAEANPWLVGAEEGQNLISNAIAQHLKNLQAQKAMAELPYAADLAKSTAAYKTAMANYLMSPGGQGRGLSPLGKLLNERAAGLGSRPGTTGVTSPGGWGGETTGDGSAPEYDLYGNKILKETTDTDTRKRNLFSTNIEKTQQSIDPADLTVYSGVSGAGKHVGDILTGLLTGVTPERMSKYAQAAQNAEALATQVRQFYGASITPEAMKDLNKLTNPSSLLHDQPTAMKLYDKYSKLLNQEMQTYRQAMKAPGVYTGNNSPQQIPQTQMGNINQLPEGQVQATKMLRGRQYVKINGDWYPQ